MVKILELKHDESYNKKRQELLSEVIKKEFPDHSVNQSMLEVTAQGEYTDSFHILTEANVVYVNNAHRGDEHFNKIVTFFRGLEKLGEPEFTIRKYMGH